MIVENSKLAGATPATVYVNVGDTGSAMTMDRDPIKYPTFPQTGKVYVVPGNIDARGSTTTTFAPTPEGNKLASAKFCITGYVLPTGNGPPSMPE